jgi:hypothetical protein
MCGMSTRKFLYLFLHLLRSCRNPLPPSTRHFCANKYTVIQSICNHTNYATARRCLGVSRNDINNVYLGFSPDKIRTRPERSDKIKTAAFLQYLRFGGNKRVQRQTSASLKRGKFSHGARSFVQNANRHGPSMSNHMQCRQFDCSHSFYTDTDRAIRSAKVGCEPAPRAFQPGRSATCDGFVVARGPIQGKKILWRRTALRRNSNSYIRFFMIVRGNIPCCFRL